MGFRDWLKDEMEYQGISVRELAEKSGVGKRTLDNYLMTNPQEPSVTNAYKIARALNVSIEYLLTGVEYTGSIAITGAMLETVQNLMALTYEQRDLFYKLIKSIAEDNLQALAK